MADLTQVIKKYQQAERYIESLEDAFAFVFYVICLDSQEKMYFLIFKNNEVYQIPFISEEIAGTSQLNIFNHCINAYKFFQSPGSELIDVEKNLKPMIRNFEMLYDAFIEPVTQFYTPGKKNYIFYRFENLAERRVNENDEFFINLTLIYDLSFFLKKSRENYPIHYINISNDNAPMFLERLFSTRKPTKANLCVVWGLDILDEAKDIEELASSHQQFEATLAQLRLNGNPILKLESVEVFSEVFSSLYDGKTLLLFCHFHNGLFMPAINGQYIDRPFSPGKVVTRINKLREAGMFNENIVLFAATCMNRNDLSVLCENGLKSIYYSGHDISIQSTSEIFAHLINGSCNLYHAIESNYLDGKTFIFEAWSNVIRSFYSNYEINSQI